MRTSRLISAAPVALRRARILGTRRLALLTATVALPLVFASPALAEGPWWHLTSGSRPAYLKAGLAHDEVQKLVVTQSAGSYFLEEPISIEEKGGLLGVNYVEVPFNAGAAQIQEGLEALYGAGDVEAAEAPAASKEFTITFKGNRAGQPVKLAGKGELTVSEVTVGRPDGEIYLTAENLGNQTVGEQALKGPGALQIADVLPSHLKAVGIAATKPEGANILNRVPLVCTLSSLSCALSEPANEKGAKDPTKETLAPYAQIEVRIAVVVEPEATWGETNAVTISGGEGFLCHEVPPGTGSYTGSGCITPGAGDFNRVPTGAPPPASLSRKVTVSGAPVPFGIEEYELTGEEESGAAVTQAGSHPYQLTTTVTLNQGPDKRWVENASHKPGVDPVELPKDLHFNWPPGLIGNPSVLPQCTDAQFFKGVEGGTADACPPQSAVGVATVTANEPVSAGVAELTVPLFNMQPRVGEPARFGFNVVIANIPVVIDTYVRSGGDYGITVSIDNITQTAAFLSSNITLWGTPGDPRHNRQRGWSCLAESRGGTIEAPLASCSATATHPEQHPPLLLSLPTSCTGPLQSTVLGDSWANPLPVSAFPTIASTSLPALSGCDLLPFSPQINVTPDSREASKPTGLTVGIHVPQETGNSPEGLTTSNLQKLHVTLPEGVAINPSVADGLGACSESQIGLGNTENPSCPDTSKLGTVKIRTPISASPLEGAVYLATQNANPFGSLVAMYVVAKDPVSGTLVKLAGVVSLDPQTGRITVSFQNIPQIPLEDIELQFFKGERALLATPARCGAYTADAALSPWSGNPPAEPSSSFQIATGVNGGACPGTSLPFAPSLTGGTTDNRAGGFSPLTATISREDGQQSLQSFQLHLPPGLSGMLSRVPLCPEAQANAGTCTLASQIGQTTVSAGLGGDPYTIAGRVYLTEGYEGAPFGLSIVTPVKAGPLDLENTSENHPPCDCLVIRAKIEVDPQTAQLTIATRTGAGGIPSILDGIPLQIKHLNIAIDRSGFVFNSTNCSPLTITSTVSSAEGATASPSAPFRVANCRSLTFSPKLTALTRANGEFQGHGASLHVMITTGDGEANMRSLKLDLPQRLPARLETIQKACPEKVFKRNPAGCPRASIIGSATVATPVLNDAIRGPAILVSHGGRAFPDMVLVLQGQGVRIDLTGAMFVDAKNVTSTTFRTIPDVPIRRLDLVLPEGKSSVLAASAGLCTKKPLIILTAITGQNGARVKPTVKVAVAGCKHRKTRHHKNKRHPTHH